MCSGSPEAAEGPGTAQRSTRRYSEKSGRRSSGWDTTGTTTILTKYLTSKLFSVSVPVVCTLIRNQLSGYLQMANKQECI